MLHKVWGLKIASLGHYGCFAQHGHLHMHHDCIIAPWGRAVLSGLDRLVQRPLDDLQAGSASVESCSLSLATCSSSISAQRQKTGAEIGAYLALHSIQSHSTKRHALVRSASKHPASCVILS